MEPVETGLDAPSDGPHTMRSLAENYVLYEEAWSDFSTSSSIDIIDLSRAATVVDLSGAPTTSGDDRDILLSALNLHDRSFYACVPAWPGHDEIFGWLPVEASGVVSESGCSSAGSRPWSNTLLRAPFAVETLPDVVKKHEDGVFTLGTGEDFQSQRANDEMPTYWGAVAPLRIGQSQTELFFSGSTPQAIAWSNQDPEAVLGADPVIMAVIDELDAQDVFTAHIAQAIDPMADLLESRAPNRDELIAQRAPLILIREVCDYVAVGAAAEVDGDIMTSVVYSFGNGETAAAALPSIEQSWSPGALTQDGVALDSLISEVVGVEQREHLVVVTLDAGKSGRGLVSMAGTKAPLACMQGDLHAELESETPDTTDDSAPGGAWSDTVELTARSTQYEGYTLQFGYDVPQPEPHHIQLLDAPSLGEHNVVIQIPIDVSVENTTPGDRPLPFTINGSFGFSYAYAPDSLVCTSEVRFTPKREDLDGGGCRLSIGGVMWHSFTGESSANGELPPGQAYSVHLDNVEDTSSPFFTPNIQKVPEGLVTELSEALIEPIGVIVRYYPDDAITGIGYDLEAASCPLNVIASSSACG